MDDLGTHWPFGGREPELQVLRASRVGAVIIGEAGSGRSRLAAEAVRGLPHAWAAGTPDATGLRFGAFAHLLPDAATGSLGRAAEALRHTRMLVVDDAHLLDDASAAFVRHLVVQGRMRVIATVCAGEPAPPSVAELSRRRLLPVVGCGPLSPGSAAGILASALGGHVETLTAAWLCRASRGNMRLLHALVTAGRRAGTLRASGGMWRWRGEPPMTGRLGELVRAAIGETDGQERDVLELLAFAESLDAVEAGEAAVPALERLEARGLVVTGDDLRVRLAHPLYGPALRAGVGRLRAARLAAGRPAEDVAASLAAQSRHLASLARSGALTTVPYGVGERLTELDAGWEEDGMPEFCARRAEVARLRGEVRDAHAWSTEGLRRMPGHEGCLVELALAAAHAGDLRGAEEALPRCARDGRPAVWALAAAGDLRGAARAALAAADLARREGDRHAELYAVYDAVRLGDPAAALPRLARLAGTDEDLAALFLRHAGALADGNGPKLDEVARLLEERGMLLFAAEASAQAAGAYGDARPAAAALGHAAALADACQGASTPALGALATWRLTPRQAEVLRLASAGLTNRQIAQRLVISIRTVGNHLCRAYERIGDSDRTVLSRRASLEVMPRR
ncbi:LuxR C-terminal-related transcriptional regulator [Microbispora sp. NPDC049125]|uniref:LuxR C-terminal-related transcriptional regulator n=1 Tax=Microbispora sp. NPDC049125 TaxID=3154929 RepID=UPI00346648EF